MFERIRTIKGRRYRYLEKRYREGGKVRSKSWCLGALDWHDQPRLGHGGYLEQMEQYPSPLEAVALQSGQEPSMPAAPPQTPATPSELSPDDASSIASSSEPGLPSDQE